MSRLWIVLSEYRDESHFQANSAKSHIILDRAFEYHKAASYLAIRFDGIVSVAPFFAPHKR